MSDLKRMEVREFVEAGYLQEVNRQFFHPHGLALAVEFKDGVPQRLAYIIDAREDPEGYIFENLTPKEAERGRAIVAEQERRLAVRRERLGFGVQELPHPEAKADLARLGQGS